MADGIVRRIREEASALLSAGRVDVVIGFEEGSLPMRATPCFVTDPADTGRLTWNAFCSNNLAKYLPRAGRRVGIVAKACDTRAIVELIKEKQIRREDVFVMGVPCAGMADPARDEVLHESCRVCMQRNPVISDILIGDPVAERDCGFDDVDSFAALPADERWARVTAEMEKCIRCHACRNACPLCYCAECFADSSLPQWVGRGTDPGDVLSFHLMRVMHLAGRCVECGACARACPTGVNLGILNRKTAADVARLYGYRAGLSEETLQPLATFDPEDAQDFMLEPEPGRECT